jgi:putative transposase
LALRFMGGVDNSKDFRRAKSVVDAMHVHLVFVTQYRRHVLDSAGTDALRTMFTTICGDFGADLQSCDGEDDHVHLLVEYRPSVAIPNSLQGVSSRRLRQQRPDSARRYWNGVLCSPSSFAASCGGAPHDIIRRYVEQQRNTGLRPSGLVNPR